MEFEQDRSENRRMDQRVRFIDSVRFERPDQSTFGGTTGFDLSESGIRVRFNDYIPVGTELILQFKLSDWNVVECKGRVVWIKNSPYSDQYQAGLQFNSPENTVDSRMRIHQFIESFRS